jgi:tetratricopeptide (TPR) repeat protein
MKYYLAILLLFFYSQSKAQYTKVERTTTTIVEQRSIFLNGGFKASLNGRSRVTIPFDLPPNTVAWYYSFSTSPGDQSLVKNLKLALQIGTRVVKATQAIAPLVDQLSVPAGTDNIDVYLLTADNRTPFIEKWDNSGGTFYYITEGTTLNTKQAVVRVDDVRSGRFFLGLKNPKTMSGVHIYIEVVALVQNSVYVDEWTAESKNNLKLKCLQWFYTQEAGKDDVCNCLVDKISNKHLPSYWMKQNEYTQETMKNSEMENCFSETNNFALKDAEVKHREKLKQEREELEQNMDKVKHWFSEANASSTLGHYSEAREKMLTAINFVLNNPKLKNTYGSQWIGNTYNSIAWYSILMNDIDTAGQYLRKSLTYNAENMYMRGNLGLFHLLKGNYPEAEKAFLYYKRWQKLPDKRKWVDVIKEDLNTLEQKGMGNSDFDRIRKLLKIRITKKR